jgi:hypothetical protein
LAPGLCPAKTRRMKPVNRKRELKTENGEKMKGDGSAERLAEFAARVLERSP